MNQDLQKEQKTVEIIQSNNKRLMAINEQLFVKIGQISKNGKVGQQEEPDPLLSQEIESLKLKIDCLEQ